MMMLNKAALISVAVVATIGGSAALMAQIFSVPDTAATSAQETPAWSSRARHLVPPPPPPPPSERAATVDAVVNLPEPSTSASIAVAEPAVDDAPPDAPRIEKAAEPAAVPAPVADAPSVAAAPTPDLITRDMAREIERLQTRVLEMEAAHQAAAELAALKSAEAALTARREAMLVQESRTKAAEAAAERAERAAEATSAQLSEVQASLREALAALLERDRSLETMQAQLDAIRTQTDVTRELAALTRDVLMTVKAREPEPDALARVAPDPAAASSGELAALKASADTVSPAALSRDGQEAAEEPARPKPLVEVHFEPGSARLTVGGRQRAQAAAEKILASSADRLRIVGHSDRSGGAQINKALSQARAESVARFLIEAGIDPAIIDIVALGESAPPIATPDGVSEPLNRCVGIFAELGGSTG